MAEIESLDIVDASNTERFPEGQAAGTVNNGGRATEGIIARFHEDLGCRKSTTGSANAYLFAAAQTLSAYYDGLLIGFDANFENTGAATLNIDSLGAKTIKKNHDTDLASGDIEIGQKVLVAYDGTNFQMISQVANAVTGGDVAGPASATNRALALYSGTTGKVIKDGPALGTSGQVLTSNGAGADPSFQAAATFAAGTSMLFQQTAAPTGWTKQTMHNNKAIRLQSGTVVTGGAVNFSTVFGTGKATDSHTLTSGESAAHTHVVADVSTGTQSSGAGTDLRTGTGTASGSSGGGGGHTHNLSNFNLQFVDFIIADKD